jgi:DNA-binding response OmpR family regulator
MPLPSQILLIDDDPLLRRGLTYTLQRAGYRVRAAADAAAGFALARESRPDLVLLDIGPQGMDGLDALRILEREYGVPVVLLTARRGEQDEVAGLVLGAHDYIKKPYNTDVLLARVAAILRRHAPPDPAPAEGVLRVGSLHIDRQLREAWIGADVLDLTPRTFELLHLLALRSPSVVPMKEILTQVWGAAYEGEPQVLYVHMRWLREALRAIPLCDVEIVTVHRVGYKLVAC